MENKTKNIKKVKKSQIAILVEIKQKKPDKTSNLVLKIPAITNTNEIYCGSYNVIITLSRLQRTNTNCYAVFCIPV